MARKSQAKAIAARATSTSTTTKNHSHSQAPNQGERAAKKSLVKRPQPLKNVQPSPLAVRMQQDLQLAGMAERTAESYIRAVRKLAAYTHKSPDLIDEEELRAYFYYIRNDQLWEASSIRVAYSATLFRIFRRPRFAQYREAFFVLLYHARAATDTAQLVRPTRASDGCKCNWTSSCLAATFSCASPYRNPPD